MSNTFYAPGEQRAAKVNDLFAAIARRYDLINDLQSFGLHRRWKRRVVKLAAVKPGDRALDLCCGTGDIAFALAQRGAETTGLDFSAANAGSRPKPEVRARSQKSARSADFRLRISSRATRSRFRFPTIPSTS